MNRSDFTNSRIKYFMVGSWKKCSIRAEEGCLLFFGSFNIQQRISTTPEEKETCQCHVIMLVIFCLYKMSRH